MTNQKPIDPLPSHELVQQWDDEWWDQRERPGSPIGELPFVATKAAQWGFNQRGAVNEAELQKARDEELEACCEWLALHYPHVYTTRLKRCRRPKPKSLAEQKQAIHDEIHQLLAQISASNAGALAVAEPIRAALERLRELEGNQ